MALRAEWGRAHGIKPPLTREDREQLKANEIMVRDMWIRAHTNVSKNPGKHHGRIVAPRKSNIPVRPIDG